ncbi:hypothetical protein AZSI13_08850 [Azospira sp. I13]|uniref:class I SAM-dependent methyltransferase n=1 Tax=Azospira sp. I13 TaxID=1765050 RepID=UPI000D43E222|nr:class I SAM-dependent methyltransferase [Azospira sp. I13]GBG01558.1 hypothetical protein AZSI13_08850 [Azospira sp. I13]
MSLFEADLQLAVVKHLKWMPDRITIEAESLVMEGWVVGLWDTQDECRFLINGIDFDDVAWPLPSPDLLDCFPDIPQAAASRFRCTHHFLDKRELFPGGVARFNITDRFGEHAWSYRTAWFLADRTDEPPVPPVAQIAKVIGSGDENAFLWGGATIVSRFACLLAERFGRPIASFNSILDWGCGVGRLTRHLLPFGPRVTGMDMDLEAIQSCTAALPNADFMQVGLLPPVPVDDSSFDLVLGLSVMPHLTEAAQDAWLAELQRITVPGGLLLLSVQGLTQMALYRMPKERKLAAQREGVHDACGVVPAAGASDAEMYPRDILHSPSYILSHWGKYFEVLDIIEAIAGNQDVVVMRRRAD